MKNKLSNRISNRTTFWWKEIPILIVSVFSAIFFSCNNPPPVVEHTEATSLINYDSLIYKSFVLDRATILADPRLAKNPAPPKYNRLILKLLFQNQSLDTLNLDMLAYPAKESGASTHGEAEAPIYFKTVDTLRKLPSHLILGNNYVNWEFIKGKIYEPNPSTNLRANFSHIIFIPRDKTPLVGGWNGHLHYGFRIVNNDGSIEFPPFGGAGDASKPSPPAQPN
jgi:hypothetical protein